MARIAVVGPGRVGTALAITLQRLGHQIIGAYCRQVDSPKALAFQKLTGAPTRQLPSSSMLTAGLGSSTNNNLASADVYLITVPDKAVTETAQTLVMAGILRKHATRAEQVEPQSQRDSTTQTLTDAATLPTLVVHTAGSLSAAALSPAQAIDLRCICMHPLQTIASADTAPDCFRGITFTLDGEATAIAQVSQWIRQMQASPVEISAQARGAYHASAVLASNALVALAATAATVSGLPNGLTALLPLMRGAVDNLERLGIPDALTGPIERGDLDTVSKHLAALHNNPTAFEVYRILGQATVKIARQKGTLTVEQLQALSALLVSGH